VKYFSVIILFFLMGCGSQEKGATAQELLLDVKFPVATQEELDALKREIYEYIVSIDGKQIGRFPSKKQISDLFKGLPQEQILSITIEAKTTPGSTQWIATHEVDFTVSKPKEFWMEKQQ